MFVFLYMFIWCSWLVYCSGVDQPTGSQPPVTPYFTIASRPSPQTVTEHNINQVVINIKANDSSNITLLPGSIAMCDPPKHKHHHRHSHLANEIQNRLESISNVEVDIKTDFSIRDPLSVTVRHGKPSLIRDALMELQVWFLFLFISQPNIILNYWYRHIWLIKCLIYILSYVMWHVGFYYSRRWNRKVQ